MKIAGVLIGLSLVTGQLAHAVPTRQEAYRNDALGVTVFKDSSDPNVFWYLPLLKPFEKDGRTTFRKRVRANGNTDYTFYIVPHFPDEIADLVASEIPGLHDRQQLKPVFAKKFGLQAKLFGALALSEDVSDYRYLNNPQLVRLSLAEDDAADFEDLFTASPGVPVNMVIYYESERVEKYLQIELTYREVYDAMKIQGSGRYTFTKAEISAGVSDYLSNKYLTIKSKGDIKMPEIVEKVIAQCFTPVNLPKERPANATVMNLEFALNTLQASRADALRETPPNKPAEVTGETGGTGPDAEVHFTFKRELADRNEKFLYLQEEMSDRQEIAVIPAYLNSEPSAKPTRTVKPLAGKEVFVLRDDAQGAPKRTGIFVKPGDQWTIHAAFTFAARSPYHDREFTYYRWDSTWASPHDDLYYRVGSGPWLKVNGRALIGAGSLQSGEISFYQDRAAIWNKLPKDFRESSMLGLVPAIFPYADSYPIFNVTLTGRSVELRQ